MKNKNKKLSEQEIDRVVVAQADDDSAWSKPVHVDRTAISAVSLPTEIAARAAFFARLHREGTVEEWVKRIVQERLDMEEAAFAEMKRELANL